MSQAISLRPSDGAGTGGLRGAVRGNAPLRNCQEAQYLAIRSRAHHRRTRGEVFRKKPRCMGARMIRRPSKWRKQDSPKTTGLPSQLMAPVEQPLAARPSPALRICITAERIAETQRVWGNYLGRPIPEEEAIEMLVNVHQVIEVLAGAVSERKQGGSAHEGDNLGARIEPRTERGLLN